MRRLILILFLLSSTACSTAPLVKTEYIRQEIPPLPAAPDYYDVLWQIAPLPSGERTDARGGSLYCLDEENAKNLLKNIILLRARAAELAGILESMKH